MLTLLADKFGCDVYQGVRRKARLPIVEVAQRVFRGTVMLEGAVVDEAVGKLCESMDLVMLVEFKLTELDLALDFVRPVFGLLLSVEVVADGRVTFDANDCAPAAGAVFVFTLEN